MGEGRRKRRRRVESTDELRWKQLKLLFGQPEQVRYEELRPLVLFGSSVAERAVEIEAAELSCLSLGETASIYEQVCPLLSTSIIQRTGGLASSPGSCRIMPAEVGTYGNGSSEMRVLLSTDGSRGDVEPMVGLTVRLRALAAAAGGCDALVATGVMPAGVRL